MLQNGIIYIGMLQLERLKKNSAYVIESWEWIILWVNLLLLGVENWDILHDGSFISSSHNWFLVIVYDPDVSVFHIYVIFCT